MATAVNSGVIATVLQASNWASSSYKVAPLHMGGNAMKALLLQVHRASAERRDVLTTGCW